jgi:hypothetical protein
VNARNVIIWVGMLMGVLVMGGVAYLIGPQLQTAKVPPALAYVAVVLGIAGPVAAHVVRFTMRQNPVRYVLSFALGEAGALTAAIVWMLTGATLAMTGYAIGVLGFMSLYPGAPEDIS